MNLVLSLCMAARTQWCSPDDWLLLTFGALRLRGCSGDLVLFTEVAALEAW